MNCNRFSVILFSAVFSSFWITGDAHAQATADALREAEDAFGSQFGDESIGIYTLNSVRGFDLSSAGNYRFDGAYFVNSAGTSRFFVERQDVRIGYNTLTLDFPGPSGVVDIKLRDLTTPTRQELTIGSEPFGTLNTQLLANFKTKNSDYAVSVGMGANIVGQTPQGAESSDLIVAGIVQAQPAAGVDLKVFFGDYGFREEAASKFQIVQNVDRLPPRINRRRFLGQPWAVTDARRRIIGASSEFAFGGGWRGESIFVATQTVFDEQYTTLFTIGADLLAADGVVIASPRQSFDAISAEAIAGWRGAMGKSVHDISLHGRLRRSHSEFGGELHAPLGEAPIGTPTAAAPPPDLGSTRALLADRVDQISLGLSYQALIGDRVRLNLGVMKTRYERTFQDISMSVETGATSAPWLYNVGAAVTVSPGVELYGSYSRGLEESGRAPSTAANANEILPAGLSTQKEIGIRTELTNNIVAFVAGFDTTKPLPGLSPDTNEFRLIGDVRHRGIELSVSGSINENLRLVAGGVYIDAAAALPVGGGETGKERPIGVPDLKVIANLSYSPATIPGLTFDGGIEYISSQRALRRAGASGRESQLPDYLTANLGVRYALEFDNIDVTLRAQIQNLSNTFSWTVTQAEILDYISPRSFRFVATAAF